MQVYADLLAKRAAERRALLQADSVQIKGRKADPLDGGSDDEDEEEDQALAGGLAAAEGRSAQRAAEAEDGFQAELLPKKRKRDTEAAAQPQARLHALPASQRNTLTGPHCGAYVRIFSGERRTFQLYVLLSG